jgi:hypothetical protein
MTVASDRDFERQQKIILFTLTHPRALFWSSPQDLLPVVNCSGDPCTNVSVKSLEIAVSKLTIEENQICRRTMQKNDPCTNVIVKSLEIAVSKLTIEENQFCRRTMQKNGP